MTELTGKHFAEVAGVHLHDDVSFDRWLTWAHAARAAFQVKKPGSCVFTLWIQRQLQDVTERSLQFHTFCKQFLKKKKKRSRWDPSRSEAKWVPVRMSNLAINHLR